MGHNKNIMKIKQDLLQADREVGLEVNTEKTKYMVISCCQNADLTTVYCLLTNTSKIWQSSSIWE